MYEAADGLGDHGPEDFDPRLTVERAPGHEAGSHMKFLTRALLSAAETSRSGSTIRSHPRTTPASRGRGHVVVIEDLGSTNGTYLNEEPLNGPQPLHPGDRIRIGDSEFSYQQ